MKNIGQLQRLREREREKSVGREERPPEQFFYSAFARGIFHERRFYDLCRRLQKERAVCFFLSKKQNVARSNVSYHVHAYMRNTTRACERAGIHETKCIEVRIAAVFLLN